MKLQKNKILCSFIHTFVIQISEGIPNKFLLSFYGSENLWFLS